MAASPRAHLLLLLLHACHVGLLSLRATALSFSYNFSAPGNLNLADLKYINDSFRSSDRVDLTIRYRRNSTGRVFHPQPVRLWDGRTGERASFNTSFTFAINGNPAEPTRVRGDGMAFFVGPFPPTLPPDSHGAFLGLFDDPRYSSSSPRTVAVEFDTYQNALWDPPDIDGDHMGIDVNSIRSSTYTMGLRKGNLSGTMSAKVMYNASSKLMVVTLQLANGSNHTIQAPVDFRDAGLPQDASIGFSAATGGDIQTNQLLSWSFSSTDPTKSSKIQLWVIVLLSAAAAALLAGLVAALLCIITKRRQRPMEIPLLVARKFSYHELSTATNNFSEDRKLGQGSFGEVYRGELRDPRMPPVAVKRLTTLLEHTRRDYVTEIMTLGQLSHRNLVKLVGWCNDDGGSDKLLLVYELVTNKSLDDHLHGSLERLLTWPERYKIVLGIGSAVQYLHTGYHNLILHRDIKPSNVMLDDDFVAKLGDFGLVRQVDPEQGGYLRGTDMIGSNDYIDPVCITTDSATTASDMYSFGVLLLEIATGKIPGVLRRELGRPNALVETVRESYSEGNVLQMADERLNGDFEEWQMERVLVVGLLCVQPIRRDRPGIRAAVNLLSDPGHPVPQVRV